MAVINKIELESKDLGERISNFLDIFWSKRIKLSFNKDDMPIDKSVNNIADFITKREVQETIEIINKLNQEIDKRLEEQRSKSMKDALSITDFFTKQNQLKMK